MSTLAPLPSLASIAVEMHAMAQLLHCAIVQCSLRGIRVASLPVLLCLYSIACNITLEYVAVSEHSVNHQYLAVNHSQDPQLGHAVSRLCIFSMGCRRLPNSATMADLTKVMPIAIRT